jgi:hypothetical protein
MIMSIAGVHLDLASLVSTAMPMMSTAIHFTLTKVASALRRIKVAVCDCDLK